ELGSDSTIIDGGGVGRVISVETGVDTTTVVSGFTMRNGYSSPSGGIRCANNSSPIIKYNLITNNVSVLSAGGIGCNNSSPIIFQNTIEYNTAQGSSGDQIGGGGIGVGYNSSPVIKENIIRNNVSLGPGGGLATGYNSSCLIEGNTISENTAEVGGGIACAFDDFSLLENNEIKLNTATQGGGIWCRASCSFFKNIIEDNTALYGGGMFFYSDLSLVEENQIRGNTATSGNGGGIYCQSASVTEIHRNHICENNGHGIFNEYSSITIPADSNWWGDPSGPYHPVTNPGGTCNAVSDYVDYVPWSSIPPVGLSENTVETIAGQFLLHQNYPNPFNPITTITFYLPKNSKVTLKVFNMIGQEVSALLATSLPPGSYTCEWNASDMASGMYLYRLEAEGYEETRKMVLMK
ncbi:MAG: right-handed parallel beta-helix repeat-containing protein, partial [bacterium]